MILSICMMVKNEESNIRRCLESLKKLRISISNELIIVDTGSTDKTVSIAKDYTESIYFHEWDNNFSEMRNITMSYAKGKWILIIDADEELIDDSDLIRFLSSSSNKNIVGASLYLRNIKDLKHNNFSSELTTTRLIKNGTNACYEGSVHNRLVLFGEVVQLKSVLNHYGYILDDKELMEKKFSRTKNMLIEELKRRPDDFYLLYQLSASYGMHNDWNEAYFYSKKAFEVAKNSGLNFNEFPFIISEFCKDSYAVGNYNESIEIASIGIESEEDFIDLYYYKASSHGKLKEINSAIESYKNYLLCFERFDNSNFKYNQSIQHYSLHSRNEVYTNLAVLNITIKEYREVIKYVNLLFDIESEDSLYIASVLEFYLVALVEEKEYILLRKLFEKEKFELLSLIEKLETILDTIDPMDRALFYEELSEVNNYYGTINKLRYQDKVEIENLSEQNRDDLIKGIRLGIPDSIYLCLKLDIDIEFLLFELDEVNIMNQFALSNERFQDFELFVKNKLLGVSNNDNFIGLNAQRIYTKYLAIKHISEFNNFRYFEDYINAVHALLKRKYTVDYLTLGEYKGFSNREEQFGAIIFNIFLTYDNSLVLMAFNLYPEMKEVLIKWLDYRLNKGSVSIEMNQLRNELKIRILDFIKLNKYEEALVLVEEILKLIPYDIEMIGIKSEILLELNNLNSNF